MIFFCRVLNSYLDDIPNSFQLLASEGERRAPKILY